MLAIPRSRESERPNYSQHLGAFPQNALIQRATSGDADAHRDAHRRLSTWIALWDFGFEVLRFSTPSRQLT